MTPRPVQLALRLSDHDLPFVVVGSTARWLIGGRRGPRDLDVVVRPQDLNALVGVLDAVGLPGPVWRRAVDRRADTPLGPLDVFFSPARGQVAPVDVAGRQLQVLGG